MIKRQVAIDLFDGYISDVVEGNIVACKHVVAACKRHLDDMERSKSGSFPYIFDKDRASRWISAFSSLFRHTIGDFAGSPFVLSPWQAFIIGSIGGWVDDTGKRRFRRVYTSIGRKNGKSTLAAGLAIILADFDGESQSQVYIGATKADQAKIIFHEAGRMIRKSPILSKISDIRVSQINFPRSDSFIRPLGSDRAFDGLNPHGMIFDELHAWKELHRPFYNTLTTGSAARSQPLRFTITTAGDNKSLIWKEENEYAINVVSGRVKEETYFVYIAALDSEDELFDENCWIKSMPNLGVSVGVDYIREQAREASISPIARNRFARYFGNIEVSSVEQAIDPALWDSCCRPLTDWRLADAIAVGLDAGGHNDIGSWCAVARFIDGIRENGEHDYRYELRSFCYMDQDTQRDLSEQPWQAWVYTDKLKVTSNLFATMRDDVMAFMQEYGAKEIVFDPWNMRQMGEEFTANGFEAMAMNQNRFHMHEPLTLLLELIRRGRMVHDGSQPIYRWALGNLVINTDSSGKWMPDRKHSSEKIDPVVASIMALRRASLAKPRPRGSLFVT